MLEPKASRFWLATLQSGLASEDVLRPCWEAVVPEKRVPEHIDRRLARQAVQAGVLTVWQAQQILSGRSTGFKIDRYVLLELIGQGGMGRVYLARDSRLNRRVAVKILSPERVNNPRAIARFHREALVGAQLQHENLVRIYDEGEAGGRCYLVMEFIEGRNIGQMINAGGPMPPGLAAGLARQVALGLEHAQRKGLIHRDVNPFNILVTRDGVAKLTDMGLAIDLAEQDPVTRDGATVGTFDYISPEQARHSRQVDTRSDIYSLGCTLYHMLAGRVPFPSTSLPEKLFGHQSAEPEPLERLVPGLPEGLAGVVSRSMRKSPDDRFAHPLELASALEPFADDTATAATGSSSRSGLSAAPPAPTPADAMTEVSAPAAPDPPREGGLGIDLGFGLGLDAPAPPPARGPSASRPKDPPAEAPVRAGPGLDLGLILETGSAALSGGTAAATAGIDLGLNFDPAPKTAPVPPTPAPAKPKTRTPVPPPQASEPPPPGGFDGDGLGIDLGTSRDSAAPATPPSPPRRTGKSPVPAPATAGPEVGGLGIDLGLDPTPGPAEPPPPKGKVKPRTPPPASPPAPMPMPRTAGPDVGGTGVDLGLDFGPAAPVPGATPTPAPNPPQPKAVPPAPSAGGAGNGLGLDLDFGPRPSEARPSAPANADGRARARNMALTAAADRGGRPAWVVPALAGGGLLLLVAAVAVGTKAPRGPNTARTARNPAPAGAGAGGVAKAPKAARNAGGFAGLDREPSGNEVVAVAGDDTATIEPDLASAVRAAVGGKGYVRLQNREPLTVSSDEAVTVSNGTLVLRAAPGIRPVLRVEIKGRKPFLGSRGNTSIRLVGVTIEARYTEPGAEPAGVIEAGGGLTLDRCALRTEGRVAGSRALIAEGGSVTATGCLFEDFDYAADLACFAGTTATFRQCVFARTRPDEPAANYGWAVRLRGTPGGGSAQTGRKVVLDHDTLRGQGLLSCEGFGPGSPLTAEVNGCAVAADALIAWGPQGTPTRQAIAWRGTTNQYDVRDKAWVRLTPGTGQTPVPWSDGPTDLDSWGKLAEGETAPAPPPVRFAADLNALSARPEARDYAVVSPDAAITSVGADPEFIGPGATALPRKP